MGRLAGLLNHAGPRRAESRYKLLKLNAMLAFWPAYILTRPFGASLGDFLSQARTDGGVGLGTTVTSGIFLTAILALVTFLAISGHDRAASRAPYKGIAFD